MYSSACSEHHQSGGHPGISQPYILSHVQPCWGKANKREGIMRFLPLGFSPDLIRGTLGWLEFYYLGELHYLIERKKLHVESDESQLSSEGVQFVYKKWHACCTPRCHLHVRFL